MLFLAKEEESAAEELEKSGVDDDETNESGTTPSPLGRVTLLLLATSNGNDDAITGIGEEVGGSSSVFEGTRAVFALLSQPSNGSVFVVRLEVDVAIADTRTGRLDAEIAFVLRSRSSDGSIFGGFIRTGRVPSCCGIDDISNIDSVCSRFKRVGAEDPVVLVLVLGEFEFEFVFVVLDDTAMAGIIGEERTAASDTLSSGESLCTVLFEFTLFVGKVRVVVAAAAAASPQHQSPTFQFLLLPSMLVVRFIVPRIVLYAVLLFVHFVAIT